MEEDKKVVINKEDYSEHPVIMELYLADEAFYRKITNVVKFTEYSNEEAVVERSNGDEIYIRRPIVMMSVYNR